MTRALVSVPTIVMGLVVLGAVFAVAWACATSRTTFEDAGRFFPIDQYEAAARLDRLGVASGPEMRVWVKQDAAGDAVAVGHVVRPTGMASFWLMRGADGGIGAVTSTVDRDAGVGAAFEPVMADLAALDRMWGTCGWANPDYEVEAVHDGERLHFRFDRACAERVEAFGRVVEIVGR